MADILRQIPPYSIEAEQAILGAMMGSDKALTQATEALSAEEFYSEAHRSIFSSISELYTRRVTVDVITVTDQLRVNGVLDAVGGSKYLTEMILSVPPTADIWQYIELVKEKVTLRRLIDAANEIIGDSYQASDLVSDIVNAAGQRIYDIAQMRGFSDFESIQEILIDVIEQLNELMKVKGNVTGVPTGFADLDFKTGGFQNSDLILIAARPSMGKSSLAINIAQHVAIRENITTAIFSLEMSKEQLVHRILSSETLIPLQKLRAGDLTNEQWAMIMEKAGIIAAAPLYFDDTPGITVMEMLSKARRLKAEKNLGMIIIDYIQLMSGGGNSRNENRQQEISKISRSLKIMARELNIPVVALSQLSRGPESRADHRPMLSDLRESGAIEQDADVVAFLYRDDYYNPETEKKNIAELIIAKQRNGPTGTLELVFLNEYTTFRSIDKYH